MRVREGTFASTSWSNSLLASDIRYAFKVLEDLVSEDEPNLHYSTPESKRELLQLVLAKVPSLTRTSLSHSYSL